jgi:hypothetical protein
VTDDKKYSCCANNDSHDPHDQHDWTDDEDRVWTCRGRDMHGRYNVNRSVKDLRVVTFGNVAWVFDDKKLADLSYTAAVGTNQDVDRFDIARDDWDHIRSYLPANIVVMDYTKDSKLMDARKPANINRIEQTRAAMEQTGRDLGERRDV